MNCWRWAGVIFAGAEAFNVVGSTGIAAAGAAAAIAAIVYGALTPCVDQNVVIGLACWFLFESSLFVLSGVLALRKAKDATALRAGNARLSTELHAAEWGMAPAPRAEDISLAVEALEANNRDLSAERVELRRRIRALEGQKRALLQGGEGVAVRYRRCRRGAVKLLQVLAKEPGVDTVAAAAALSARTPEKEAKLLTSALQLAAAALEERKLWEAAAEPLAGSGAGADGE